MSIAFSSDYETAAREYNSPSGAGVRPALTVQDLFTLLASDCSPRPHSSDWLSAWRLHFCFPRGTQL
jgi:hypothetical protein